MAQEMDEICRQINQDNDVYVVILPVRVSVFCAGSEIEKSFHSGKKQLRSEAEISKNTILPPVSPLLKNRSSQQSTATLWARGWNWHWPAISGLRRSRRTSAFRK
jgi:hypothetical protein